LYRYRRRRPDSAPWRVRIEEIAAIKRRYGYRRVYLRLRREGWKVNRKRVYRLYREAGLAVRRRKRKRIGPFERNPMLIAAHSVCVPMMSPQRITALAPSAAPARTASASGSGRS
jgi:transposase InsO family protein